MTYSILISSKQLQTALEALCLIALLVALLAPRFCSRAYAGIESRLCFIARHRTLSILAAAAFPMLVRVALLPVFPEPMPYVHDEFSYLLMADTFAHGRIANPSPPEPRHFETEYTLLQPTYASQYQPAQGIVMAAGQVLTGRPWWGVWASVGLMCGALCWALGGLFPPAWALCGALGAALQFGILGFWMNSYFGGAVAATGGALVAGALLRLSKRPVRSAVICGAGLIVVLASRPFEGILWSAVAAIWIAVRYRKHIFRIAMPAGIVCILGLSALALYDYGVTRRPFQPPYAAARAIYGTPQSFWWQPPVIVTSFDNPQLRDNYLNQLAFWNRRTSPRALWDSTWRRMRDFWRFFIGPFFTPALLFVALLWRHARIRHWLYVSLPFLADHATYHAWYPQQSAAETVLIVMLVLQCWRHLRAWKRERGWGLAMSRNLIAGFALAILLLAAGRATEGVAGGPSSGLRKVWASLAPRPHPRDRVMATLETLTGKHLVFVHYGPTHPYIDEWVFNQADIPGARIVFARMIDPDSDIRLIRAMKGYDVWMVDADTARLVLLSGDPRSQEAMLWSDVSGEPMTGSSATTAEK